jgi:hypothetical protein
MIATHTGLKIGSKAEITTQLIVEQWFDARA